ncbi:hypothetical protein PF002_g21491 [Phytophthora fragariae]|nr:hypothetical protein PF002_g21491 [Phytophthora fragariae]
MYMGEDKLAHSITSRQINDARYKLSSYIIHDVFEHAPDWHSALTSFQLFNAGKMTSEEFHCCGMTSFLCEFHIL